MRIPSVGSMTSPKGFQPATTEPPAALELLALRLVHFVSQVATQSGYRSMLNDQTVVLLRFSETNFLAPGTSKPLG